MDSFFIAFIDNKIIYFSIVFSLLVLFNWLVYSKSAGFFDPLYINQFLSAFASASVIFMFVCDVVNLEKLISHLFCIVVFWTIFCGLSKYRSVFLIKKQSSKNYFINNKELFLYLKLSLSTLLITQLITWSIIGFPLFMESRLDAYAGTGLGILNRILSFLTLYVMSLIVLSRLDHQAKFLRNIGFAFLIIIGFLNGGKSFILSLVGVAVISDFLFYRFINGYTRIKIKPLSFVFFIIFLIFGALLSQAFELKDEASIDKIFSQFLYRFILSGDGYLWFYGDGLADVLNKENVFYLTFSDFFGGFRIVPWSELPVHPGLAMFQYMFPYSDKISGPNARLDIIGNLTSHSTAFFYYSILALLTWAFRNSALFIFKGGGIQRLLISIALTVYSSAIIVDPIYALSLINNIFFCIPILVIFKLVCLTLKK